MARTRRGLGRAVAAVTLVGGVLASGSARAEKSADEVCADLAKKAQRTLWSSVRETGDALLCRKSWLPGRADELLACGAWTQANLFGNKLKGAWNNFFAKADAEWATWGPRGISVDWEEGTIRGGFKRSFFGAGLATFKSTIEVVKRGGQAEAFVTACELDYDGKVVGKHRRSFANGSGGVGSSVKIEIEHADNRIVGVVVDTPASLNSFEYRARLLSAPKRTSSPPVKGLADLHVHQFVGLAFGGRMYWGQHAGPKSQALAKEEINITGTGLNLSDPAALVEQLTSLTFGIDANVLLGALNAKTTDEGFFKYGGEGAPSYRDWPHHADRSHQQVYIDWLKEAHERNKDTGSNLNLMVVSLVNNNILCSVLKVLDKFGNVPTRDSQGKITGWESATWGCSDQENVTRQLRALHQLEKDYPWYRVAMSPWHARQIIADGDLAVVVSMETDKPLSGAGGNYGDWEAQLDAYRALGLSTLQIVHESDSKFAGAAPHRDMMQALQAIHHPLQAATNLVDGGGSTFELDAQGYNKLALTAEGNRLVDAMVKRNMPIDLAHMGMRARKAVFARVPRGFGLYDSHTKFGRLMTPAKGQPNYGTHVAEREKEFVIMESILPDYVEHKVLVGLRTASVDVYDAPNAKVANDCPGSAKSFAQLVQYAHDSGLSFAYGTDFNTGVSQLGPRFGDASARCFAALPTVDEKTRTRRPVGPAGPLPARANTVKAIEGTNYYTDGLANIGWLPELTVDLVALGTPGATKLRDSAEAYLKMWERAFPTATPTVPASTPANSDPAPQPTATVALGGACKRDADCVSDQCTGVLGAVGVCVCDADGDCGSGKYCDAGADLTKNTCRSLKNDGETCAAVGGGHQCKSGRCAWSRCYTPGAVAMGGTCYVDEACKDGKCSAVDGARGTCVCKTDGDCGAGKWCDAGLDLKQNSCKAKLDKGEVCGTVGEVGVGHRCKSGSCKVAGFSTKLECK